jgi:hypothetical protein
MNANINDRIKCYIPEVLTPTNAGTYTISVHAVNSNLFNPFNPVLSQFDNFFYSYYYDVVNIIFRSLTTAPQLF